MPLSITTSDKDNERVVSVAGEVDVSNAPELREALDRAFEGGATAIEVDLTEVPYIDSTGIGVLVGAAHRAHDKGVGLSVSHPQHNVARVLGLLGVGRELDVKSD